MAGNQAEGKGCQAEGTASERLRGKQGPGRLEDQGQEAGVAEAERPRMKHEAAMAEPVAVGRCPDLPR